MRGFGMVIELGNGSRKWYAGEDGVRRWADNDHPVDIAKPLAIEPIASEGNPNWAGPYEKAPLPIYPNQSDLESSK